MRALMQGAYSKDWVEMNTARKVRDMRMPGMAGSFERHTFDPLGHLHSGQTVSSNHAAGWG